MARCKSIDAVRQIVAESEVLIVDSSDSDSNVDISEVSSEETNIRIKNNNSDNSKEISSGAINNSPVLSLECLHEDGSNEHPHLESIKIVAVNSSSDVIDSLVPQQQSSIPARNDWAGAHNFKIKIRCHGTSKKVENAIYSESMRKLYVAKDLPFKVLVYAENVPLNSVIKVVAVFSLVEHAYDIVQRCPTHAQQDFVKDIAAFEHVVQSFSQTALYENHNGIFSVSVPYEPPQEGENYTTYLFKLTCFSSCSGGINRRPFMLVFTLEKDNIPLGRQTLNSKVCACPFRDFKADEERELKNNLQNDEPSNNKANLTSSASEALSSGTSNKRKQVTSDSHGIQHEKSLSSSQEKKSAKYIITTYDHELYVFLKQMKSFYAANAFASSLKPDT